MSTRRTESGGRLRVGFITPGLGMGGAERWVLTLAKHLCPHSIDVTGILSPDTNGPLAREAKRLTTVYKAKEAANFASRCDVVIAWAWERLAEFRKLFRGRLIAVSHGAPGNQWGDTVTSLMSGCRNVELVGVSDHSLNVWPNRGTGIYLPNGAEVDRCAPRQGGMAFRFANDIPLDAKVALFCGRICAEKRPWAVVGMLPFLPPEWRVVVCGPDQAGWGAAMAGTKRVHFLPPQHNVGDVLAAADVFVLPSETEAHPIALCEAWLAGVPTVYCEWPIVAQLRKDHLDDIGVPVPLDCSPQHLAAATLRADIFRDSLAIHAQRVAWEHYTASAMAARWEKYLNAPAAAPPSNHTAYHA